MKKYYLTLVAFSMLMLSFSKIANSQNSGNVVFAGTQVHTIDLQFPQTNYWDSLTIYYNQGNEQYLKAAIELNGVTVNDVGIRFKGNSTFSHPNNKKPFKISLDEYINDQLWDGMKSITLNNCYLDPTLIREKVYLDYCRDAGIIAPRCNFVNLYINGVLWGFYSMVESVDKKFLTSRFGENDGNLFKAVDAFGSSIVSDLRWYGSDQSSYYNRYELKTNEEENDWTDLVTFLDTLNNNTNTARALPTKINVNTFYKALATDIIFGNLDAYVNSGRNFHIYDHNSMGKFEWIIWDVGLCFGAYPAGVTTIETMSVTYVGSSTNRPLISKIYNTPELKNDYLSTVCLLTNTYFSSARLNPLIDSIANFVRPHVYADTRKQYTNANFETNLVSDIGSGTSRKPGLKSFISQRSTSIQSQLTTLGVSCALSVGIGDVVINEFAADNDTIPDPAGEFDDWIELYNNTNSTLNIGGLYLTDNYNLPAKWQIPANTTIAPRGFLIVWADEDSGQVGLHASFKLSADGERIRLSNTDASNLDSTSFGAQPLNRTMARLPNGTGPFVQGAPTFNSNNTITSIAGIENSFVPDKFTLQQNYPNPFNPSTLIRFTVPENSYVSLKIFDQTGKEIALLINENKTKGYYEINFDGSALTSGIYYYSLWANGLTATRRMVLLK